MTTAKRRGRKTGLPETIQLALRRHPVFSRIRQFSWGNLLKQSQLQTLKAGQTICREGEPARTAWLVLEGEVKLVRHRVRLFLSVSFRWFSAAKTSETIWHWYF